jgi:heme A synthase
MIMLVLGTMVRHMNHPHALYTHVGLSIVVVIFISIVGAQFAKHKAHPVHGRSLRRIGTGANALVGLQFLLGWVALLAFLNDPTRKIAAPEAPALAQAPAIDAKRLVARTIHQSNGALLMSSCAVMCAWGLARRASSSDPRPR